MWREGFTEQGEEELCFTVSHFHIPREMDGRLGESAEASPRSRLVPGEAGAAGAGARGHAGHQLLHRQLRAQGQRPGRQVRGE